MPDWGEFAGKTIGIAGRVADIASPGDNLGRIIRDIADADSPATEAMEDMDDYYRAGLANGSGGLGEVFAGAAVGFAGRRTIDLVTGGGSRALDELQGLHEGYSELADMSNRLLEAGAEPLGSDMPYGQYIPGLASFDMELEGQTYTVVFDSTTILEADWSQIDMGASPEEIEQQVIGLYQENMPHITVINEMGHNASREFFDKIGNNEELLQDMNGNFVWAEAHTFNRLLEQGILVRDGNQMSVDMELFNDVAAATGASIGRRAGAHQQEITEARQENNIIGRIRNGVEERIENTVSAAVGADNSDDQPTVTADTVEVSSPPVSSGFDGPS